MSFVVVILYDGNTRKQKKTGRENFRSTQSYSCTYISEPNAFEGGINHKNEVR